MSDVDPDLEEVQDQVEETPVETDEDFDWQQFLEDYYSGPQAEGEPATVEPEESPPEPEESEDVTGSTEPTPPAPAPQFVEIAGRQIPISEADRVGALYDFIQQYPEQAAQFGSYLLGDMQLVPKSGPEGVTAAPPTTEQPPARTPLRDEDMEYLPPAVQERIRLLDEYEDRFDQIGRALTTYEDVARQQYEQVNAERARAAQGAINAGTEQFKTAYDLSDDEVQGLMEDASKMGVVAHLAQQYQDPVRAVSEALELAYLRNPDYRDREFARRQAEAEAQRKKDKKLGAISGAGGSVNRSTTPSTPEEKRAAMVREISEAMR